MTKKELLRGISFLLVVCLMMFVLCDLFEQENGGNTDRTFYTYRSIRFFLKLYKDRPNGLAKFCLTVRPVDIYFRKIETG